MEVLEELDEVALVPSVEELPLLPDDLPDVDLPLLELLEALEDFLPVVPVVPVVLVELEDFDSRPVELDFLPVVLDSVEVEDDVDVEVDDALEVDEVEDVEIPEADEVMDEALLEPTVNDALLPVDAPADCAALAPVDEVWDELAVDTALVVPETDEAPVDLPQPVFASAPPAKRHAMSRNLEGSVVAGIVWSSSPLIPKASEASFKSSDKASTKITRAVHIHQPRFFFGT